MPIKEADTTKETDEETDSTAKEPRSATTSKLTVSSIVEPATPSASVWVTVSVTQVDLFRFCRQPHLLVRAMCGGAVSLFSCLSILTSHGQTVGVGFLAPRDIVVSSVVLLDINMNHSAIPCVAQQGSLPNLAHLRTLFTHAKHPRLCFRQGCGLQAASRCSKCRRVWYCSRAHQRADWKLHKRQCITEPLPVLNESNAHSGRRVEGQW